MRTVTIKEETPIPGTNVVLEEGDKITIKEDTYIRTLVDLFVLGGFEHKRQLLQNILKKAAGEARDAADFGERVVQKMEELQDA